MPSFGCQNEMFENDLLIDTSLTTSSNQDLKGAKKCHANQAWVPIVEGAIMIIFCRKAKALLVRPRPDTRSSHVLAKNEEWKKDKQMRVGRLTSLCSAQTPWVIHIHGHNGLPESDGVN